MPKLKDNGHLLPRPRYPIGWVRKTIEQAHTQKEWQDIFRELPGHQQVQFLLACQPKVIENKGDSGLSVTFVLNGVRDGKTIQGTMVNAALNPPIEDNEDDPE